MFKKLTLVFCLIAIACDATTEVAPEQGAVEEANKISYEIRAPELKFSVSEPAKQRLLQSKGEFDLSALVDALNDVTDDEEYVSLPDWEPVDNTSFYEGENDNALLHLNTNNLHVIVRDKRGYDISQESNINDEYLLNDSKTLLTALGSTEFEFGDPQVRYLSAYRRGRCQDSCRMKIHYAASLFDPIFGLRTTLSTESQFLV